LKLLVFSDIHNDWKALERLLATEADYYIAAGDQVTWARGLEKCGEILQRRAGRVYVLPGNHESADDVARLCVRYGLHDFHEAQFQVGDWQVAGLGYSNPTPFNTPGEYSERELAARLARFAGLAPVVRAEPSRWANRAPPEPPQQDLKAAGPTAVRAPGIETLTAGRQAGRFCRKRNPLA
jgi:hypothetical protein